MKKTELRIADDIFGVKKRAIGTKMKRALARKRFIIMKKNNTVSGELNI